MLERYRNNRPAHILLVIGLLTVATAGLREPEREDRDSSYHRTAEQSEPYLGQRAMPRADMLSARNSENGERDIKPADQIAEKDLYVQRWMAWLSGFMTLFTFVGIGLLYKTLRATDETLGEARKATEATNAAVLATREIGEAQVRGYPSLLSYRITIGSSLRTFNERFPEDKQTTTKDGIAASRTAGKVLLTFFLANSGASPLSVRTKANCLAQTGDTAEKVTAGSPIPESWRELQGHTDLLGGDKKRRYEIAIDWDDLCVRNENPNSAFPNYLKIDARLFFKDVFGKIQIIGFHTQITEFVRITPDEPAELEGFVDYTPPQDEADALRPHLFTRRRWQRAIMNDS